MVDILPDSRDQWLDPAVNGNAKKFNFKQVADFLKKEENFKLEERQSDLLDQRWLQLFWAEGLWQAISQFPGLSAAAYLVFTMLESQGVKFDNVSWNVDNNTTEIAKEIQKIKDKYKTEIKNNKDHKNKLKEIYRKMYEEILKYLMDNYKDNKTDFEKIMDMKIEQAIELHKIENPEDEDWEPSDSEKITLINDTVTTLENNLKLDKNSKEHTKLQLEKIKYECGGGVDEISEKLKDNEDYKNLQIMFKEDWKVENINKIINIDPKKIQNFIEALAESGITKLFLEKAKEDSNSDINITADLINGTTELYIQLCTKILKKLNELKGKSEQEINKKEILGGILEEIKNEIDQKKYDNNIKEFLKWWCTVSDNGKYEPFVLDKSSDDENDGNGSGSGDKS